MRRTPLVLALISSAVFGQTPPTLTVNIPQSLPAGCNLELSAGPTYVLSCSTSTTCPPGQTGTPPNCVTPPPTTCPPGQVGTPPNCTTPPPSGGGNCSGYTNTLQMSMVWGKPGAGSNYYSNQLGQGSFGQKSALVIKFTTPAGTSTNLGSVSISEYQSPQANRWINKNSGGFSLSSCDFSNAVSYGIAPDLNFTVGPNSYGAQVLQPSTTYYINVHNDASCGPTTDCVVLVTLKQPQGL